MELEIQALGEDAVIRLPVEFLKKMNLKIRDKLTVEIHPDGAFLKRKPRYSLAELVQQCDSNSPQPSDMADWDHVRPLGHEK